MIENANEQTVAQLVAAAIDGDARSWNGIVRRYDALVRAVVDSYRMQAADNEDAVQSTWLRAVERIHTLRQAECLPAWLATVARRECLALPTRTRRERPDSEAVEGLVERAISPELMVLYKEACGAAQMAVDRLPTKRRRLVKVLYYGEDQDYLSASNATGMPIGSIGPTRMRVMSSLRETLASAGFDAIDALPA